MPALISLVDHLQLRLPPSDAAVTVHGSILAALANAGLDRPDVLDALCRSGAVAVLLKLLKRKRTAAVLLDNGAALLARLSGHPTVLEYMRHVRCCHCWLAGSDALLHNHNAAGCGGGWHARVCLRM